jgi:predicted dehydrogenase
VRKWKIAIVGAGYMAQEHARALNSINVELVGVCSRTAHRAEALARTYNIPVYETITEMYAATRADAVVVAVPEFSTPAVCQESFGFPWVCLLEKPVGLNLEVATRILDESRRARASAFVALNRRSYSATRRAIDELAKSDGPRLISILDQEDQDAARAARQPEEVVQNWMYANSIHLIDYFTFLARGDIVSIQHSARWAPESPRFVATMLRFSSGDIGVYQAVWNAPGPWGVAVTTPHLRLEMRPLERLSIQARGERRATEIEPDAIDTEYKPGLHYQAEQLVAALEGRQANLATLEQAHRSMALCAEIYGLVEQG